MSAQIIPLFPAAPEPRALRIEFEPHEWDAIHLAEHICSRATPEEVRAVAQLL